MKAKLFVALALVGLLTAGFVSGAGATPTLELDTTTTGATGGDCDSGNRTWTVNLDVTINNTSATETDVVTAVNWQGKYEPPPNTPVTPTVVDDGGLVPGVTILAGESQTFHVVLSIVVPCGTTNASAGPVIDIQDGHKTFSQFSQFISEGTGVPVGTIGLIVLAAGLGAVLLVVQRRRSHALLKVS